MTHPYDKYRQDEVGERRAKTITGVKPQGPSPAPESKAAPQRLGDSSNLWDSPKYENMTPSDWRRGYGMKPNFKKG